MHHIGMEEVAQEIQHQLNKETLVKSINLA